MLHNIINRPTVYEISCVTHTGPDTSFIEQALSALITLIHTGGCDHSLASEANLQRLLEFTLVPRLYLINIRPWKHDIKQILSMFIAFNLQDNFHSTIQNQNLKMFLQFPFILKSVISTNMQF